MVMLHVASTTVIHVVVQMMIAMMVRGRAVVNSRDTGVVVDGSQIVVGAADGRGCDATRGSKVEVAIWSRQTWGALQRYDWWLWCAGGRSERIEHRRGGPGRLPGRPRLRIDSRICSRSLLDEIR